MADKLDRDCGICTEKLVGRLTFLRCCGQWLHDKCHRDRKSTPWPGTDRCVYCQQREPTVLTSAAFPDGSDFEGSYAPESYALYREKIRDTTYVPDQSAPRHLISQVISFQEWVTEISQLIDSPPPVGPATINWYLTPSPTIFSLCTGPIWSAAYRLGERVVLYSHTSPSTLRPHLRTRVGLSHTSVFIAHTTSQIDVLIDGFRTGKLYVPARQQITDVPVPHIIVVGGQPPSVWDHPQWRVAVKEIR